MSTLVRRFESFTRIADGGTAVSATLDIYRDNESTLRLHLHGDVKNSLVFAGVAGTVIATLCAPDGSVYSQIRVDVDEAPPRSPIGEATARGHNAELVLKVGDGASPIGSVRFESFDRNSPGIKVSDIKDVAGMLLPVLLAA